MKRTPWKLAALAFVVMPFAVASAAEPRHDINPALLYFQAFNKFPELDEAESKLLGTDAVGNVTPEERDVAEHFNTAFKILLRARSQKAPCDWGTDPSDGPHAFTPNFIKIRTAVYAAVLRARLALADGQQERMRDELLAASVLSRHAATDATLVGVMIQVAVEAKILDFISPHFEEIKPTIRSELARHLNGPPHRSTVAEAMTVEREVFNSWFLNQLATFRATNDDAKAVAQFRAVLTESFSANDANEIISASGGTSEGITKYFKAADPAYARCVAVANTKIEDVKQATKELEASIERSTNVLVRIAIPNLGKARGKELEFLRRLARLPDEAP
jgi:hypothetical protein